MDIKLSYLPDRPEKPRKKGVTMVMDKGLSVRETEDFISAAGHLADFAKLGFGTSQVMNANQVQTKVKLYQDANIKTYFGGTLFEAFVVRNQYDDYLRLIDKFKVEAVEVSDGSLLMDHHVKCEYIRQLSKNFTVLSEVGSKEAGILISPAKWIQMMSDELESGSKFVIAEARESGTVGIYRPSGTAHISLVNKIINKIPQERILWEAPLKSQQTWFVKQLGANVNIGNVAPNELVALETLRIGLRGDTFFQFLPDAFQKLKMVVPSKEAKS